MNDSMIKNMYDNVTAVSTGFKHLSNRVESSLTTPKIEFSNDSAVPVTLSTPSKASGTSGPPHTGPSRLFFNRRPPPQLLRDDFKLVKFWTESGYNKARRVGRKGLPDNSGEDDLPEDDTGGRSKNRKSILSTYLEDKDGTPIPEGKRDAVRATARAFFEFILGNSRAPATWGIAAIDVRDELHYILETEFPFLRYCEGHWKAQRIATNSYSQWYGKAMERVAAAEAKKAKELADAKVIDVDTDNENNSKTLKRPRDDEDNAPGPSKRHCHAENPPIPGPRPRPTLVNSQRPKVCNSFYIAYTHG